MDTPFPVSTETILKSLDRITNQIFKLLPSREEGLEWQKPLGTLIIELKGMSTLFKDQSALLMLICKLEGLKTLDGDEDFNLYRGTIFECLSLVNKVKEQCQG